MKKLLPLFLILLLLAGALYFQEQILDRFMDSGGGSSTNQAPPGLPSLDLGQATTSSPADDVGLPSLDKQTTQDTAGSTGLGEAPPGLPALNLGNNEPTKSEVSEEEEKEQDDLNLDDLFADQDDSDKQDAGDQTALTAPPGLPALSFGTAPVGPSSQEVSEEDVLLSVPELSNQELKNSFIKFSYPQNISVQNVSLSSVDLNSIESKLLNVSYFNNEDSKSVKDFVKDSSSVTDFFAESEVVELGIEGVDEVFLATDLVSQTKFYLIVKDNLFILIEMDIEREYEFVEQILIPSIESQII